jgi:hypothetical protein
MRRSEHIAGVLFLLVTLMRGSLAGEVAGQLSWNRSVNEAWKKTQQDGRPLLVFVTRADCFYCVKMKGRTYNDSTVAALVNRSFVPLVLDGGTSPPPLLKELNVSVYPTTFIISPRAVILDRIDGYVAPEALCNRLKALQPKADARVVARVAKDP